MAWERQEAMDWLHGPNRRSSRLSGLESGAASSLFLALERAGCTVEVLAEDVVDGEAAAVAARERAAASRICRRMDAARKRMRSGVARLRRDARAALAFRLANRAMRDQMRQHDRARGRDRDPRAYRWRPFQLAFLLAVVESTIDEGDGCRDVLDLIWFPTGGGKTEAYLGLIAFLSVWRRLQYGDAGGGTAVLMRYTLRLLTRQQFERAARIVCALELLRRRDEPRLGREPFTVGLWVGRAVSPNTCAEALERVGAVTHGAIDDGDTADAAAADARSGGDHLVLQSCPWCRGGFTAPHSFRTEAGTFAFQCGNPECPFGDGTPLPCNVVDEVLYENPPTLLIGTVDKFARLVWEERAGRYLGGSVRRRPKLVIQGGVQRMAGALGSVAGVYEAWLETALERRGVRRGGADEYRVEHVMDAVKDRRSARLQRRHDRFLRGRHGPSHDRETGRRNPSRQAHVGLPAGH